MGGMNDAVGGSTSGTLNLTQTAMGGNGGSYTVASGPGGETAVPSARPRRLRSARLAQEAEGAGDLKNSKSEIWKLPLPGCDRRIGPE
jgi:hypothetical protein